MSGVVALQERSTQAGLKEEALTYWYQAGERALGQAANEEAIRHLQTGLALLDTTSPSRRSRWYAKGREYPARTMTSPEPLS